MFARPSQTRTNELGSPTEDPSKIRAAAAKISQDPSRQIPHYKVLQPLFGRYDLDRLKAHIGPNAKDAMDEMDAEAATADGHVGFRKEPDLSTAAHEAFHGVTQLEGSQPDQGVGEPDDRDEEAADTVASAAVRRESVEGMVDEHLKNEGHAPDSRGTAPGAPNPAAVPRVVQRRLSMERRDGREKVYRTVDDAWNDMMSQSYDENLKTKLTQVKDPARQVLKEWISPSRSRAMRILLTQPNHDYCYLSADHMARAVYGTALSRGNRDKEAKLAAATKRCEWVDAELNNLTTKVYQLLLKELGEDDVIVQNSLRRHRGAYGFFYGWRRRDVFRRPASHSQTAKISVIADASKYLHHEKHLERMWVPEDKNVGTAEEKDGKLKIVSLKDFDIPDSSELNEWHDVIKTARDKGMPLAQGPSYTTGMMMQLAEWARANAREREALAWALFAFWNKDYWNSHTLSHTFHEVMDMARNYGVRYDPFVIPVEPPVDPPSDADGEMKEYPPEHADGETKEYPPSDADGEVKE
jgi:hypothetical protein